MSIPAPITQNFLGTLQNALEDIDFNDSDVYVQIKTNIPEDSGKGHYSLSIPARDLSIDPEEGVIFYKRFTSTRFLTEDSERPMTRVTFDCVYLKNIRSISFVIEP